MSDNVTVLITGAGRGAIGSLQADHGINSLDIVISNAGICSTFSALAEGEQVVTALEEHVEVNAYGMLRLFQNTLPLLRKSKVDEPKFAYISSPVGALNLVERIGKAPAGIYGASKAFANYIVRRLAIENDGVTTWSISPGLVDTDMSATAMPIMAPPGLKAIPVQESAAGIMKVVAEATHERTNGHFINYDGAEVPW
ncbi:Short-chain dehydrogenase/reductase SDR [Lasiodiplodia theobromae]|uniref:Short chain dehydrogenase gsfK n=1 Tax=Lasiodiplodia theobromae TaxID=45133 RepID=A0A5N5DQE8_9PEZI|nr:Short-chain dehydrogenase/reductase SDR [Lasiodiplodia theobromae]KAB2579122.1 Short chain dehydrogenase gsfK [Lasiodiplodia theobromae]KAF4537408.1 Short-chain dehydrogenase/reductase SDR [Lasiodiplodia theobromae]